MSNLIQNISLSGNKNQVSNKEMTFLEKMYLLAIGKGLIITIKHFFRKKATIQFPEQVREMSPVYRGKHVLKRDEQGRGKLYSLWSLCSFLSSRSNYNESSRT